MTGELGREAKLALLDQLTHDDATLWAAWDHLRPMLFREAADNMRDHIEAIRRAIVDQKETGDRAE